MQKAHFLIKIFQPKVTALGIKSKPLTIACQDLGKFLPTQHAMTLQTPPSKDYSLCPSVQVTRLLPPLSGFLIPHDSALPDTGYLSM